MEPDAASGIGWSKRCKFTLPSSDVPLSNLNLTGWSGGKLSIPDADYPQFLERYANDLLQGVPQHLTECRGDIFRLNFDLDHEGPPWDSAVHHGLASALFAAVKRFFPNVVPDDKTFMIILCTAPVKDVASGVKNGVHLIMPNCVVDRERMLCVFETYKGELRRTFDKWNDIWDAVCDESIYSAPTSGLRMIGSNKVSACPTCKTNKEIRKTCTECFGRGKIDAKRPYKVECVYQGSTNGVEIDERLTKLMKENIALAVKWASIRTAAGDAGTPRCLHTGWTLFDGCPVVQLPVAKNVKGVLSCHIDDVKTKTLEFKDDRKGSQVYTGTRIPMGDPRISTMLLALRRLHDNYTNCDCREALVLPANAKCKEHSYLLKVKGMGANYCINKQGDHNSNTVYFIFTLTEKGSAFNAPHGSFHQRCFSRKPDKTDRIDGLCCGFASDKKRLRKPEREILWPSKKRALDNDFDNP